MDSTTLWAVGVPSGNAQHKGTRTAPFRASGVCASSLFRLWVAAITLLFVSPRNAYAYIDPGIGSLVLQSVIGAALAGLLIIKLSWRRIRDGVRSLPRRKSGESQKKATPSVNRSEGDPHG